MSRIEKADYIARAKRKHQAVGILVEYLKQVKACGKQQANVNKVSRKSIRKLKFIKELLLFITSILITFVACATFVCVKCQLPQESQLAQPVQGASHVTLNGLALVVVFDRPVNLSASIELVEQRHASAAAAAATAYDSSAGATSPQLATEQSVRAELKQRSAGTLPGNAKLTLRPARVSFGAKRRKNPISSGRLRANTRGGNQAKSTRRQSFDELLLEAAATEPGSTVAQANTCERDNDQQALTSVPIAGIQLCAQLLTRKTLRQLQKFKLFNCIWASQVQFIVQLGKPVSSVRVAFSRGSIVAAGLGNAALPNERELAIELSKLPLEGMGAAAAANNLVSSSAATAAGQLAPRLALTGPNLVPACGQFSLSAHLSSAYGTQPDESVRLEWSVARVGVIQQQAPTAANGSNGLPSTPPFGAPLVPPVPLASQPQQQQSPEAAKELRWLTLSRLVGLQRSNNLLVDTALLEFGPQQYEFKLSVTFATSLASFKLNTTHLVSRLDFDAPIGAIYGTHMLATASPTSSPAAGGSGTSEQAQQASTNQLNTNQELALVADVQVPECAQNIKQVGLYWQVNDPRVRFEQTYAPYYVAKANSLPEQALVEFRLNLFYGIRVKRFASASAIIATGDSVLDASISDGLLMASVGKEPTGSNQLELRASEPQAKDSTKFTYQWSCFDGRTAQVCSRNAKQTNQTIGGAGGAAGLQLARFEQGPGQQPLALVDKTRARQPVLKLPLAWLDFDAQLWFGLQRFDRQNPSQQSKTEYALVGVQALESTHTAAVTDKARASQPASVSIGPLLVGQRATRQPGAQASALFRATVRNPLTGAIIVLASVPALVVGRLRPASKLQAFSWRLPNYAHPLHWTTRNATTSTEDSDELVTELHLNPELLVAHSSHQVQLVACWNEQIGAQSSVASISLDVVQGIGECRVELFSAALLGFDSAAASMLPTLPTVSVNYCNIPLGLSPATYQLYVIDTSLVDSLLLESNGGGGVRNGKADEISDHLNEADELYLEAQAQALSVPQLSPVFQFGSMARAALSTLSALAGHSANSSTTASSGAASVHVRFAARVCDRLASCKMFYSSSLNVLQLISQIVAPNGKSGAILAENRNNNKQQQVDESLRSLWAMLEGARRANTAGNSIAAISVLNTLLQLTDRLLVSRQTSKASEHQVEQQARDLLQLATRDCLHYGAQSLQRPFHYTESGQTNLVLGALGRILGQRHTSLESKYRALRLIGQLIGRKTIDLQNGAQGELGLAPVSLSVPDFRTIQATFEQVFAPTVLVQHSLQPAADVHTSQQHNHYHKKQSNRAAKSNSTLLAIQQQQQQLAGLITASSSEQQHQPTAAAAASGSSRTSRRKREEAMLVYLRAIRQAHMALLQAAAVQLPLGSVQQFEYQQQARQTSGANLIGTIGARQALSETDSEASSTDSSNRMQTRIAQLSAPVDIVSSLTHQTDLLSDNIDVDLHEFGSISIRFAAKETAPTAVGDSNNKQSAAATTTNSNVLGNKLSKQLASSQLRCKNDTSSSSTQARCSSFVLALTSYAGRAPFRALSAINANAATSLFAQETAQQQQQEKQQKQRQQAAAPSSVLVLRAPIIQLDWLSPIDGSNLIELLRKDLEQAPLAPARDSSIASPVAPSGKPLTLEDFKGWVTFSIPIAANEQPMASQQLPQQQQPIPQADSRRFKCYQFDETTNEWQETQELAAATQAAAPEQQQAGALGQTGAGESADSNVADDEPEDSVRQLQRPAASLTITCAYRGYGALGLFQGRPPNQETPTELSIAIGLAALVLIVGLLSFLGCFASKEARSSTY